MKLTDKQKRNIEKLVVHYSLHLSDDPINNSPFDKKVIKVLDKLKKS